MTNTDKKDDTPIEADEQPAVDDTLGADEITSTDDSTPDEQAALRDTSSFESPLATKEKRSGGAVAWLALLISLLAAAGVGYGLYADWQEGKRAADSGRSLADLTSRMGDSQRSIQSLDDELGALAESSSDIAARLEGIEREFDERLRLIDSLPARMSTLEQSVASLRGLSAGARNTLLLAEAEYYMQIANAQLQLAGNPELAALALGMADDRILQLADPGLTDVRRAVADELAALESMAKPDVEGATLTLASLSRVVESLPLIEPERRRDQGGATFDPEASRMARVWSAVKGAFAGLVTVRKTDETERALLAPDSAYFLRTNLSLQLQTARLALLRGQKTIFEQSVDDADAWVAEYFDADSAQVASFRETIAEIRNDLFTAAPPDISESLRLLRQYQTLAEPVE